MPYFGAESVSKVLTLDDKLQRLLFMAIKTGPDFKVISGKRTVEEQESLVSEGKSKTMNSKHLHEPSLAVDIAPWPVDWQDRDRFLVLAGYILGLAEREGINLRWGGDWDGDWTYRDQKFHDLGHFELVD